MFVNYNHSIINITSSILKHYHIKHPHQGIKVLDEALEKDYSHIVLVLLDGFGHNLIKAHLKPTDFLSTNEITTVSSVFPSTTAAATTSVLTGLTPYETGFLGWFQYFKDHDLHYTTFLNEDYYDKTKKIPKDFNETHFSRETFIEKIQKNHAIKGKVFFPFPIDKEGYNTLDKAIYEVVDYVSLHDKSVNYLYITEPDLTEHKTGTLSKETKSMAIRLNDLMQRLYQSLPNDALLIITADHGHTDVKSLPLNDFQDVLNTFEHKPSIEPRATSFHILEGQEKTFETLFNKYFSDDFDLYTKQAFLEKGFLGHGKKHYLVDECLGNYFSIAKGESYFQLDQVKFHTAHHAGATQNEMEVPLIFKGKR